jgi:hypothetical protein
MRSFLKGAKVRQLTLSESASSYGEDAEVAN